jgi:hypothetical protein
MVPARRRRGGLARILASARDQSVPSRSRPNALAARQSVGACHLEGRAVSPTYENIPRLANGLQVDVAELFNANPNHMNSGRRSITRAGHSDRLNSLQYDHEMPCAFLSNKQFVPLLTTLRRIRSANSPAIYIQHAGEDFIYVPSG